MSLIRLAPALALLAIFMLPSEVQAGNYPKYSPAWHMKKHGSYPKEYKKKAKVAFTKAEKTAQNLRQSRGQQMTTYNVQCIYNGANYGEMNILVAEAHAAQFEAAFMPAEDLEKGPGDFSKTEIHIIEGWVAQSDAGRVKMLFRAPKEWR